MSDNTDGTDRSFIDDLNDTQKGLLALRLGYPLDVVTPTGNQFEVQNDSGETVLIDHTNQQTQYGEEARERLKNTLRAVGTECTLHTGSYHTGDA